MDTNLITQLSKQIVATNNTWYATYAVRNGKVFDITDISEPTCIWSLEDLETFSANEKEIVLYFQDGMDLVLGMDRWRFLV